VKITGLVVVRFEMPVDRFGLGEPLPGRTVVQTLTRVLTDEGVEGSHLGGHFHGDQDDLLPAEQALVTRLTGALLAGRDRADPPRRDQAVSAGTSIVPPGPCPPPGDMPGALPAIRLNSTTTRARESTAGLPPAAE